MVGYVDFPQPAHHTATTDQLWTSCNEAQSQGRFFRVYTNRDNAINMTRIVEGPGFVDMQSRPHPFAQQPSYRGAYMYWHHNGHIADIIQKPGMPNAFRHHHIDERPENGQPPPNHPRP